jgi:hypothetical protein
MPPKKTRLPRYARGSNPPPIKLTARDKRILETIYAYDGILGFTQIQRLFFTGRAQCENRLKLLYQNRYLNRPGRRKRMQLPEMVYWLDRNGAEIVAGIHGERLSDFKWREKPRWAHVEHDLYVNDFRLDLEAACRESIDVKLETWVMESELWAYPDRVVYRYAGKELNRYVRPDGFFMLKAKRHRIRYLLEIDRSTEDNPRFYREKILPGLAYLKTDAYEERFGHRSGRWLVVTTGERRLRNLLNQARRAKAHGLFYFTTFDQISAGAVLHAPIWQRTDREQTVPMVFLD